MSTFDAFLSSWPFDPWILVALAVTGGVYLRGWLVLRRRDPDRWTSTRLIAFLAGLGAVFMALASPIDPFAALLLQVHMVQHLLLMMVAPPLLWLGAPLFPLLRGLPRQVRTYWVAPLFRSPGLRGFCERLTHPRWALPLYVAATWVWHVPAVYDLALRSNGWHYLQHLCFLGTALLFWYPVVRPYPARPRWSQWLLLPYLLLADVQNTVLSALLTFSDRVLYPYYAQVPRLNGLSALADQEAAGVIMWVPGSVAFLLPLFVIGTRVLFGEANRLRRLPGASAGMRLPLPMVERQHPAAHAAGSPFDLLRVPLLGRFLKWRRARLVLQVPLLFLAVAVIYDGLTGPQVGAMNLAGVLPWVHWRGLVVLALLALGNVFCMACPFMLPRTAGRFVVTRFIGSFFDPINRVTTNGWSWPRPLRSKWLAVLLLGVFLWAYEAFALWDSPWWTAWIALGYFTAAFVVDGFFRGAAFCKYVCPIGQFNFVQSLVSPLEVKVRDPDVCATCRTRDCLRGRDGISGCELRLFQPRKAGNMDCTFCLDCVHACPHDNVGVLAVPPGRDLWRDPPRSGVGAFGRRPDLAALILLLVFGAFANAAGMVGPVLECQDRVRAALGQITRLFVTSAFYAGALVILPLLAVAGAATLSRRWGRLSATRLEVATRFAYALVPLGFGMWLAHYGFHLATGYDAVVPVTQRFAADLGWAVLGEPQWASGCCRSTADWLLRAELLCLDVGWLLSLYAGYRIAVAHSVARPVRALLPWAVLMALLFVAGVWIVLQPMQMRGLMTGVEG
jgi:cytochrome c oxidase assembly factor CtaG